MKADHWIRRRMNGPDGNKESAKEHGDESGKASYQSLSGASEGVALLDRRGVDDSQAQIVRSTMGLYGPIRLMTAV